MFNNNDKNNQPTKGGKGNQSTNDAQEGKEEKSPLDEENSNVPPKI